MRASPLVPLLSALAFGCGTNRPEIPSELLGTASGCDAADYPSGPYGGDRGATVANVCFRGYRTPADAARGESGLEDIALADYHDPNGDRYELLLLNSAALWCAVCQSEHGDLPSYYADFAPRGFALVSALFQDERAKPADLADLELWVDRFDPPFPMVLDPDYQLGTYATAETAPLNLLIDARSMRIVEKFIGDNATALWGLVESELDRREAGE